MEAPEKKERFTLTETIRTSQTTRILLICLMTLLLQIPISMIDGTIGERQSRSQQATEEVATKWGRQQTVIGPIVTVPYEVEVVQYGNGLPTEGKKSVKVKYAHFLPKELHIEAVSENLFRHRGIFDVPVYRVDLQLKASFRRPSFADLGEKPSAVLWDKVVLSLLISDPRAISKKAAIEWNGNHLEYQPGTREFLGLSKRIQVVLKNTLTSAEEFTCTSSLSLQGSGGLFFAPMGENTSASLQSNWPDPSFQGEWLPVEQSVTGKGFSASWQVSSLGRNFSQQWIDKGNEDVLANAELFGVDFIEPVNSYRMTDRSIKYQILFLALTFITLWLFEVLAGLRLHPLQYLLVGSGMCLFYLLVLSLAEHIGFLKAYVIAASSIILLQGGYCMAILRSARRAMVISTFIALLYSYLYTLLIKQDYALLAGAIGMFLLLAAVMFLTRKIDWYGLRV